MSSDADQEFPHGVVPGQVEQGSATMSSNADQELRLCVVPEQVEQGSAKMSGDADKELLHGVVLRQVEQGSEAEGDDVSQIIETVVAIEATHKQNKAHHYEDEQKQERNKVYQLKMDEWKSLATEGVAVHQYAHAFYGQVYFWISALPTVVISASTSIFSFVSRAHFAEKDFIVAIMSALAGILTSVAAFWKWQGEAEKHRSIAKEYSVIGQRVDEFDMKFKAELNIDKRGTLGEEAVKEISRSFESIRKEAGPPPPWIKRKMQTLNAKDEIEQHERNLKSLEKANWFKKQQNELVADLEIDTMLKGEKVKEKRTEIAEAKGAVGRLEKLTEDAKKQLREAKENQKKAEQQAQDAQSKMDVASAQEKKAEQQAQYAQSIIDAAGAQEKNAEQKAKDAQSKIDAASAQEKKAEQLAQDAQIRIDAASAQEKKAEQQAQYAQSKIDAASAQEKKAEQLAQDAQSRIEAARDQEQKAKLLEETVKKRLADAEAKEKSAQAMLARVSNQTIGDNAKGA